MISFDNVSKFFLTPGGGKISIVTNLDFHVESGAFVALMGPSGVGKSTLLNIVAGLDVPQSGDVVVNGSHVSSLSTDQRTLFRGKNVSFVFQQFHLLPQLTVQDNIDLVLELNNLERRYETAEILKKVGLGGRANDYPPMLSGGEQQRVALARAFVAKTPVLLADEPTGNLDASTAHAVMELLSQLHAEVDNTIIMITHDEHIARYADDVYLLDSEVLALQ